MKMAYYIKLQLKKWFSNITTTVIYLIMFPILIASFMSFFMDKAQSNPLKLKQLNVQVIDEDESEMSNRLVKLFEEDDMKELFNVVNKKPDLELVIKKGYEDDVNSLKEGNITINKKVEDKDIATDTLKSVLDKYHENLYIALAGGDLTKLEAINKSSVIEDITIDKEVTATPYEKVSTSMISFVIMMLASSFIQGSYNKISENFNVRVQSTSITKFQYLIYESVTTFIYMFVVMGAYVCFFRLTDLGFRGSLVGLILLVALSSVLAVAINKFVLIFNEKLGKMMSFLILIIPLLSNEVFGGEGNFLAFALPTHYLTNAFSMYNMNGNLGGTYNLMGIVLIVSIVLYLPAVIKSLINGGDRIWA